MKAGEKIKELRDAVAVIVPLAASIKTSRMEEMERHELPQLLGRLISDLDLQREFIAMGKHVRNFADAQVVIGHLMPLLEERLDMEGTIGSWKLLDDLTSFCKQAALTNYSH